MPVSTMFFLVGILSTYLRCALIGLWLLCRVIAEA